MKKKKKKYNVRNFSGLCATVDCAVHVRPPKKKKTFYKKQTKKKIRFRFRSFFCFFFVPRNPPPTRVQGEGRSTLSAGRRAVRGLRSVVVGAGAPSSKVTSPARRGRVTATTTAAAACVHPAKVEDIPGRIRRRCLK